MNKIKQKSSVSTASHYRQHNTESKHYSSLPRTNHSLDRDTGTEISPLIALLHLLRVLRALLLLLVNSINSCEPFLAKRARVLPFSPFFNAPETKFMVTSIDVGKVEGFHVAHADTAVINGRGLLFAHIVFIIVVAGNLGRSRCLSTRCK